MLINLIRQNNVNLLLKFSTQLDNFYVFYYFNYLEIYVENLQLNR